MFKAITITLLMISTGCATIITGAGKTESVRIASQPRGATVFIDGRNVGTTPMTTYLTRHDDHTVMLTLDGYTAQTIQIKTGRNWWVLGNLVPFCGGICGLIIDFADGSCRGRLSPSNIDVPLVQPPRP